MSESEKLIDIFLVALASGLISYVVIGLMAPFLVRSLGLFNGRWASFKPDHWIDWLFLALVTVLCVLFAIIDIRKYETLGIFGVDFAYFDQAIWNSLSGRILENTIYLDSSTIMGHHFSPLIVALVPLYALLTDPRALAIVPAVAVTSSAVPIYWFAKEQIGRLLAWIISSAFLLAPGVLYLELGQFYELALIVPLLSLATLFLLRRRYVPFAVCLGLGILLKEEVAVIAIGIGIYISVFQRKFWQGLTLTVSSFFCAVLLLMLIIPHFQGSTTYYFFGGSAGHAGLNIYSYLGNGLPEIITSVLARPGIVLQQILNGQKINAILNLLLPLAPLLLVGIDVTALMVPTLGYVLLSDAPWVYAFGSWHYAPIFPFLFFGAVVGARRIVDWGANHVFVSTLTQPVQRKLAIQVFVGTFILSASLSGLYLLPPDQPARDFDVLFLHYAKSEHVALGESLTKLIPRDAVVLTQTDLVPYVSERRRVYVDTGIPCLGIADSVFVDTKRPWYSYRKEAWSEAFAHEYFETVRQTDGYILAQRKPMDNVLGISLGNGTTLLGYTLPLTGTLQGGGTLRVIVTWRANQDAPQPYVVDADLVDGQGHVWAQNHQAPCGGTFPADQWNKDELIADDLTLQLPPTMPTGNYQITLAVHADNSDDPLIMRDSSGHVIGENVQLTSLSIQKNKGSFTANELQIEQPLFVDMGEMRFLGYVPPRKTISPGELLSVGAYWRAREKPRGDYVVAVQLRDQSGRVVFEQASRPANGTYPTTEWDVGEVLLDWHDFNLPTDIAPGEYQIFVVLRDSASDRVLGQTAVSSLTINR